MSSHKLVFNTSPLMLKVKSGKAARTLEYEGFFYNISYPEYALVGYYFGEGELIRGGYMNASDRWLYFRARVLDGNRNLLVEEPDTHWLAPYIYNPDNCTREFWLPQYGRTILPMPNHDWALYLQLLGYV